LLALLGLLAGCPPVPAPSPLSRNTVPTYLFGIYKGCKRDAYLSGAIENRVYQLAGGAGNDVRRLLPRPMLENADWKTITAELTRACAAPDSAGRRGLLLGGSVEERGPPPTLTVMRLFRADLATQEIVYRDSYCRGCDVARALATQAALLLEHPGPPAQAPPALPTFCSQAETTGPAPGLLAAPSLVAPPPVLAAPAKGPTLDQVAVNVHSSDHREKNPVLAKLKEALRQHLLLTGRDVVNNNAHYVITAVVTPAGAELELALKARSGETPPQPFKLTVSCADCGLPVLSGKLVRAAGSLLDDAVAQELSDAAAATGAADPAAAVARLALPLPVRAALCTEASAPACRPAALGLDSDPSMSLFYEPTCGQAVLLSAR
jgi:hypothetical protein